MPEQYTGGLGERGIAAVKQFASAGGTILCFNHSTAFCIDTLGAPATNVLSNRITAATGDRPTEASGSTPARAERRVGGRLAGTENVAGFYSPGSLLNVTLDSKSPLRLGLPDEIAIWSEQSPAFTSTETVVATYPSSEILASGWLLGGQLIAGKAAIVDAKVGSGHIVLFGMRPQYRAQSYQAFKLFFNSLVAYR